MSGEELQNYGLRRKIADRQTGLLVPEDIGETDESTLENLSHEELIKVIKQKDLIIEHQSRIINLLQKRNNVLEDKRIRDPFTELYNKEGINRMLAVYIDDAEKSKAPMSLLVIDLDHFKSFNDKYGHQLGDSVLKTVSNVLHANLRKEDLSINTTSQLKSSDLDLSQPYNESEVGRWGGEEFVVGLTNCDEAGARQVAKKILDALRAIAIPDPSNPGQFLKITASIGGATITPDALNLPINGQERASKIREESSRYFQLADTAEIRAKNEGRDQFIHANDRLPPMNNATPLPNLPQ